MSEENTTFEFDSRAEALWRAAETFDTRKAELLLATGVDIDVANSHGTTALMRAAARGRAAMVRLLLERGANPNLCRNDEFTALMLAAFFGHQEIVEILVQHGAKTDAVTCRGTSAQMWAASRTFADVVKYLGNTDSSEDAIAAESNFAISDSAASTGALVLDLVEHDRETHSCGGAIAAESVVAISDSAVDEPADSLLMNSFEEVHSDLVRDNTNDEPLESSAENFSPPVVVPEFLPRPLPLTARIINYSVVTLFVALAIGGVLGLIFRHGSKPRPEMPLARITTTASSTMSSLAQERSATNTAQGGSIERRNQPVETNVLSDSARAKSNVKVETANLQPDKPWIIREPINLSPERQKAPKTSPGEVKTNPALPEVGQADPNLRVPPPPVPSFRTTSTTVRNVSTPVTTELLSQPKNSRPQGKTIQWP